MKTIIVILNLADNELLAGFHCMKSVQIRSFFWSVFSRIRTEYGEIRSISPYSVEYRKCEPEKTPYLVGHFSRSVYYSGFYYLSSLITYHS